MGIRQITTGFAGEVGVNPRLVRIVTTDAYADIIAPNYLNNAAVREGFNFLPSDIIFMHYGNLNGLFSPIITGAGTGTTITLQPLVQNNQFYVDVTVGFAAIASAASVVLVNSVGTQQYRVRNLMINDGGTNFSGGGGDRLGQITDGTTVYSVIPAANLQTLTNNLWGVSTPLPFPPTAAANTPTVAGADLVFKYSGGTTDYTAGSIVVTALVERIA